MRIEYASLDDQGKGVMRKGTILGFLPSVTANVNGYVMVAEEGTNKLRRVDIAHATILVEEPVNTGPR
jgi:hypothetical protein